MTVLRRSVIGRLVLGLMVFGYGPSALAQVDPAASPAAAATRASSTAGQQSGAANLQGSKDTGRRTVTAHGCPTANR